jgi:hypothetical protein
MVQSITDLQGYDYLIEWRQQEQSENQKLWITPSIITGEQLVVEQPFMFREFIEKRYAVNNL